MDKLDAPLQEPTMGDFLSHMGWLGRERAKAYLYIMALLNIGMIVVLALTSRGGVDHNGHLLGTDFISFWTSGRMLHQGANVYDVAVHVAAQRQFFASPEGYTAFFYPPTFLPLCWPLGLIGYFLALAVWLTATAAFYLGAAWQWWRCTPPGAPLWLLLLAFPAVPIVITHGQTSFLVAALLALGAWLVPERPSLAGMLFGLATIKPQFGVLVPLVLLFTHQWRAMVAAAGSALVLVVLATVMVGPHVWLDWLHASARAREAMEAGAVPFGKMITVFAAARLLGVPTPLAHALQFVIGAGVLAALIRLAWKKGYNRGLAAAMLAGAPLATPFALDYDMVLLAFPLLWLTGEGLRTGFASYEKLAILLAFVAPALSRAVGLNAGVPIAPPVLAFLFAMTVRRAMVPAQEGR